MATYVVLPDYYATFVPVQLSAWSKEDAVNRYNAGLPSHALKATVARCRTEDEHLSELGL